MLRSTIVALALLGACAFVGTGCGQSEEDQASEVAVAFFENIGDGDYGAACALTVNPGEEDGVECEEAVKVLSKDYSFEFPEANGNVDLETEPAKVQVESENRTFTALMKKVDGEWKVEDFNAEAAIP